MKNLFDRPVALTMGPQRCGVSWIYDYLEGRGDVCLPSVVKEIFYFDRHYQRGPEFYTEHFKPQPQHRLIAELTTTAFDNSEAPDHVYKLLGPNVKLICPLRHPVERSKAMYADYIKYGLVSGGIEEAVESLPQILYASRYADHLERWFTQFDRANVHILYYEALQHDPKSFAATLCNRLDLPFSPPGGRRRLSWRRLFNISRHAQDPSPVLASKDEEWLKIRLLPEIRRFEALIGAPVSYWA